MRDLNELRGNLSIVVDYGERIAQAMNRGDRRERIDIESNMDLRNFISSKNSATPYEILVLTRGSGRPDAPPSLSNGKYTMGDRVKVALTYRGGQSEPHTGVVWEAHKNPEWTQLLLDGKNGGPPFFVTVPVEGNAWWNPSSATVEVTASALATDEEVAKANRFRQEWTLATEQSQLDQLAQRR